MEWPGNPKRFEIGEGAAAGQVAKMGGPAKHVGQCTDSFDFKMRTGTSAVEGMVVGIEPHRHRISCARDGVRWLEHLSGVKRMEIGVVVGHPVGDLGQYCGHGGN